jgi:hypothetical protein
MLHFHRNFDFLQIIVKNLRFGIFCVTAYVYLGQDGLKVSFNVGKCKNNYCRGLTKGFYHCAQRSAQQSAQ